MKKIDARYYNPRALCSRLRREFGPWAYLHELYGVVVPDPMRAVKRLEDAKLCVLETRAEGGRERVMISFAIPYARPKRPVPQYPFGPVVKKRQYLCRTSVVWIMGQDPKPCRSNRVPRPGIVSYVRVGNRVELVRFVGRVIGGWLVQPA
jgi:hypothetical protein